MENSSQQTCPSQHLPVVLVGLPGSGKSRVGQKVAELLGVEHIDTDAAVERTAQTSISDIFAEQGEEAFRVMETEALRDALDRDAVISIGGGAIETEEVRNLLRSATVVHIHAPLEELLRRVKRSNHRPLLREDPETTLAQLDQRRTPLYRQVETFSAVTGSGPLQEVVDQVIEQLGAVNVVTVEAEEPYPVIIGDNCTGWGLQMVPADASKALLVVPEDLADYGTQMHARLESLGLQTRTFLHPTGEEAKTVATADRAWEAAGEMALGRRDVVVTLGGGATTDFGGFIAATWNRGVRVIHFPTTVLAMVDAAVGGKTGLNSAAGKNLIGSFYNPLCVCADLWFLRSLPQREYTAGLGEVVKCGFIADPEILALIEKYPQVADREWGTGPGLSVLRALIERAVAVKSKVVAADFREGGLREILNYGHTLAHAIEKHSNYQVHHGEAVAIGCYFAAQVGQELGRLTAGDVQRHRELLEQLRLPVVYPGVPQELFDLMYTDKKTRGDQLRFVLLDGIGSANTVAVERDLLERVATGSETFA